jgi:hypothetical protein
MAVSTVPAVPAVPTEDIIAAPLHASKDPVGIPTGFPAMLESELAWTGVQFAGNDNYIMRLGSDGIKELEEALTRFKSEQISARYRGRDVR